MKKVTKSYMRGYKMLHTKIPIEVYNMIHKTAEQRDAYVNEITTRAIKRGLRELGARNSK